MWSFSRRERDRLHTYWLAQIRERLHEDQLQDFQSLRSKHESILKKHQEGKDEVRCSPHVVSLRLITCRYDDSFSVISILWDAPQQVQAAIFPFDLSTRVELAH
jgi:hypothetical protein